MLLSIPVHLQILHFNCHRSIADSEQQNKMAFLLHLIFNGEQVNKLPVILMAVVPQRQMGTIPQTA